MQQQTRFRETHWFWWQPRDNRRGRSATTVPR